MWKVNRIYYEPPEQGITDQSKALQPKQVLIHEIYHEEPNQYILSPIGQNITIAISK